MLCEHDENFQIMKTLILNDNYTQKNTVNGLETVSRSSESRHRLKNITRHTTGTGQRYK